MPSIGAYHHQGEPVSAAPNHYDKSIVGPFATDRAATPWNATKVSLGSLSFGGVSEPSTPVALNRGGVFGVSSWYEDEFGVGPSSENEALHDMEIQIGSSSDLLKPGALLGVAPQRNFSMPTRDQGIARFQRRVTAEAKSTDTTGETPEQGGERNEEQSGLSTTEKAKDFRAAKKKPLSASNNVMRSSSRQSSMKPPPASEVSRLDKKEGQENISPALASQQKTKGRLPIGSPLPIRFFDVGSEVDLDGKLVDKGSRVAPACNSPADDSLENVEWKGKTSLWG